MLPVFIDDQKRLGIGRGKRTISQVLQWLRQGDEQLAILTNGQQWRIIFAGLDYEAFCEWDIDQWFAEGQTSEEFGGFRALVTPATWNEPEEGKVAPLLAAVNESREGQADLSQVLGERVRQAVELLIQAHAPALQHHRDDLQAQDLYRAAVRMVMRLVVVLFAESRDGLLPRDNPVYQSAYSLQGLRELLERISPHKLVASYGAYPRILALLRLIHQGSSHEGLPVPSYGGELFAPGNSRADDAMKRALHLFETACFGADVMTDYQVRQILDLLTRTKVKIRQGRSATWMPAPVDFSSLDSEYIGILYEGLLDFELRCAVEDEPIVFLAVGNQPALPLSTLEQMDDRDIKNLLEKLKDTSSAADDEESSGEDSEEADDLDEADEDADSDQDGEEEVEEEDATATEETTPDDARYTLQARAEQWARKACEVGNLVNKPRVRMTPERQMQYDRALDSRARQLVVKVVLPGEWYLVRWSGTRKGSGTFYTRPQLAIPTAHRTLRPLAYDPPTDADDQPDLNAPTERWTPKQPEDILRLKVCDPACGSGSFPLAALRFLTHALYKSLVVHERVHDHAGRAVLDLIYDEDGREALVNEALPCRPEDEDFEPRTKAILRRYVVERCIHGVDNDPLAVELCRLSLWIETLDRHLPMTFLQHKIKCGNSLVGTWFDQFLHYPAMAFEREGGDKNHTTGVHLPKDAWTKAIKEFQKQVKQDLIAFIDGSRLFHPVDLSTVRTGHDAAEAALQEIHGLGITEVGERAERYEALLSNPEFRRLKDAFDLWCALWFWPADRLEHAPLPMQFAADDISEEVRQIARQVAADNRFFHWELEFPDVFNDDSHGFDAILGNPPWDTLQPMSKEFFSAIDPLYRGYGKQEALAKQKEYFERNPATERRWLEYNASFKAMSNWVKHAGFPFGDRVTENSQGKKQHDFNLGDRGRRSFESSQARHDRWKNKREETSGYADAEHTFRHQGEGKPYTYKLFVEQAHALLADHGRLGLILPSGLYSDHGTGALRRLFVDHCRWEWLFGFENREKVFDIDSRFKFNPVIVAKGGQTEVIRTAFMRRSLADWEQAERHVTQYPREQIVQFSPRSRALLEIQSERDLEVLTKIYSNSVLLGDQGLDGWGIKYAQGDFNMTSDSKLFPPRPKWEEWGYRPDEYSRWIKGPWKPIEQLWQQLGVDPSKPAPIDPACAARIEQGVATGEVAQTANPAAEDGTRLRCAQPPYDRIPIPRADIPAGIILSRDADAFIREGEIPQVTFTDASGKPLKIKVTNEDGKKEEVELAGPAVALPLYQGVMIYDLNPNAAGYLEGAGNRAKWSRYEQVTSEINSQFLLGASIPRPLQRRCAIGFRALSNATNERTFVTAPLDDVPCGNSVGLLLLTSGVFDHLFGSGVSSSLFFDFTLRRRIVGTNVNSFFLWESAWPLRDEETSRVVAEVTEHVGLVGQRFAPLALHCLSAWSGAWRNAWAVTPHERARKLAVLNALVGTAYGLDASEGRAILDECDYSLEQVSDKRFRRQLNPKGFWRVDKNRHPEHRHTILSLIAFHDLQDKIDAHDGDVAKGIPAFCNQNDGEGWMLPETLRLADYGLGHDERAKQHQPVRECFGPRFYDWQLAQTPEESWRECHLHARNLLGQKGYDRLLAEIEGRLDEEEAPAAETDKNATAPKGMLFDTADAPLFRSKDGG